MIDFLQGLMRRTIATPDPDHVFRPKEIFVFYGFILYWLAMLLGVFFAFQ